MAAVLRELTLIVTDLHLAPELREQLAESLVPDARLPALELLLARSRERRTCDWRVLACEIARVPTAGPLPIAALARAAEGARAAGQWWIASPVHLVAAMDHVQLSEVLRLDQDEWRELASGFNREIGGGTGMLEVGSGGEAYWRAARALDARTVDPTRVAGRDVHDALPAGVDGDQLRRLMTEVQMWLHEHPLNAARAENDLPPVNGLWFWGGGVLPDWRAGAELPLLCAEDRFIRGLWSLLDAPVQSLPRTFDGVAHAAAARAVVALELRDLPGVAWIERMSALGRDWLAPALSALRANRIDTLRLHANDALFSVRRSDLLRFWRRPRPWLEALA